MAKWPNDAVQQRNLANKAAGTRQLVIFVTRPWLNSVYFYLKRPGVAICLRNEILIWNHFT
jgi:hypothetical protein